MSERYEMALTGIGIVSPAGRAKDDFFQYIRESADADDMVARRAAHAPGQLLQHLNIAEPKLKISRYLDPVSKNLIVALGATLLDAGVDETEIASSPHAYGIVLGTTRGARETRKALYESLAKQGRMVSGTIFSHCGYNIAGAMAAVAYGIKGPNLTIAGRDDVGVSLLRTARQLMNTQRAHTVFVGFTECDNSLTREGGQFSELAYVLCLERKDRAVERDAVVQAGIDLQDTNDTRSPCDESRSAGFRTCCIADFQIGDASDGLESAGLETHDTADLEVCATPAQGDQSETAQQIHRTTFPVRALGMVGDRYASLIKIGLLSQDRSLKARFPEVAFTTSVGRIRTAIRVRYTSEAAHQVLAAIGGGHEHV